MSAIPDPEPASARVRAALAAAHRRKASRNNRFGPVGAVVVVVVLVTTLQGHPSPGLSGKPLLIAVALVAYVAAMAAVILDPRPMTARGEQVLQGLAVIVIGAAGIVLAASQPTGATELPASAAIIIAYLRYDAALATALGVPITVGLAVAVGGPGHGNTTDVVAVVLLCVVLAVAASLATTARRSQDRAELLLAQLEDAREAEAHAAAAAERARIAGELHDVLAHSLSGLSIQLQVARKLAQRDGASADLTEVIDRAGVLTREGLAEARRAVGALKGDALPTVDQLPALVEADHHDMGLAVSLTVEGPPRALAADASLALYRGAQEALTNAVRYAPASAVTVDLRYGAGTVSLAIEDIVARQDRPVASGIIGGGHGLAGMEERIGRAGGTVEAGPTPTGWRVRITMPA
jgi:signal transduction histidine kinase